LNQPNARSSRFEKSPGGLRQVKARARIVHLAKIDFQNVLMTAQKDLGNSLSMFDPNLVQIS
jgi:hypothetical protein